MKRVFVPAQRKRILIVDDDSTLGHIYLDQLSHGFEVEVAGNNRAAREKLQHSAFDLVILDFSAPGSGRVELLQKIRAEKQALPVIVLSNPFLGALVRAAQDAGVTKCVTKAECKRHDFLQMVREILGAERAEKSSPFGNGEDPNLNSQMKLDATFLKDTSEALAKLRMSHHAFVKTGDEDLRRVELCEMRQRVHFMAGVTGLAGSGKSAQLASALEALFIDLHAKPRNIKATVLRTIAQAMDELGFSLEKISTPVETSAPSKVLVVDDETIARTTILSAMVKAGFTVVDLDNSLNAQQLLEKNRFDLIFLAVEMPGLDGIELCARTRKMLMNYNTPIVMVTAHSDFEMRARSVMSGGTDCIAKPFISVELTVKALTLLLKENRLASLSATGQNHSPDETEKCEIVPFTGYSELKILGAFA